MVVFFVLLVVLGSFFLIQIILAVLSHSLSQNDNLETINLNVEKEKLAVSLKRKER